MAKTTKQTSKKVSSRKTTTPTVMDPMTTTPLMPMTANQPLKMSNKMLTWGLVVIAIALLTYKLGPWVVPAVVNNRPLTRFELYSRLEASYGEQALDDMINEKILDMAIADSGIKVDQSKIDEQLATLETQFESTGGLDEALAQRGLDRAALQKQIYTQLAVEEILADQVTPTQEEIQAQFDSNAQTLYEGKTLEEVEGSIVEELTQSKLRDAFLEWFAQVKKDAKIKSFGL